MDEQQVRQLLMHILAEAVCEKPADPSVRDSITPELMTSVYRLAQAHDLAHIVAEYVFKHKIPVSPELEAAFKRDALMSVYRCEQLNYTLKEICRTFEEERIPHIPLKGSVLRPYYPKESMRTSCDIDILIHEEDLDRAIEALRNKGYRCGEREYHDVSLFSPGQIHLELHFNIQENIDSLDSVLKDAWQCAVLEEGSRYGFTKEFFVFHMYAHMAYHFLAGGCGLRSLLDIWIMERKMGAHYQIAESLLKKAGIYQFAAEMSDLAHRSFTDQSMDPLMEQMLQYIYCGGVYGSRANSLAVYRSQGSGTARYVFARIFLPYRSMTITYPILKKAPYLLPVYWVVRWCRVIFAGKSGQLAAEIACANNISAEKIAQTKAICQHLGL